jgi:D-alanine-D-alanine ligase
MKITILAYLEKDATEPDIVMSQVADALAAAGHKPTIATMHDDVVEIVEKVRSNKPDLVFNLVESFADDMIGGLMGVTGLLDLLQVPYTGGGPGELYLQEDKALSKRLLAYEQVLYPDYASFPPTSTDLERPSSLRMPLFVKPARMDASIGIDEKSLVRNLRELKERVSYIHKTFGDTALAEEFIEGREFYVSVLGNHDPIAFPPIEMDFSGLPDGSVRIMDSEAKFDETSHRYHGTKSVIADIDDELKGKLQKAAIDAYRALRVRDYGRIDMRLTESGELYVIEVNASCYLEQHSEFAMSAEAAGIEYAELINRIPKLALERWKERTTARKKRKRAAARAEAKLVKKEPAKKNGSAAD